jgi:hypothetical protein
MSQVCREHRKVGNYCVRTHTTEITETPYIRDQHLEIVSSHSDEAVNFNLFKWCREGVRVQGYDFQNLLF